LQKYSPRGVERQVPPFLQGEGEQDTKPENKNNTINIVPIIYNKSGYTYILKILAVLWCG
jgi:hypothetical protein